MVGDINRPRTDGSEYEARSDLPERIQSNRGLDEGDPVKLYKATSQTNKSFVEVDRPKGELTVSVLEITALTGEVGIHLTALLTHAWGRDRSFPAVGGLISWGYILALAAVRQVLARRRISQGPNLWNQTAVLYMVQWVCIVLLFRSMIIHPQPRGAKGLMIADFVLATVLILTTLSARKGNKPVVLEYVDDLQPSREPLASLFSIATFSWVDAIVWHGYKKNVRDWGCVGFGPKR